MNPRFHISTSLAAATLAAVAGTWSALPASAGSGIAAAPEPCVLVICPSPSASPSSTPSAAASPAATPAPAASEQPAVASPAPSPTAGAEPVEPKPGTAADLLRLVNAHRASHRLSPVTSDAELTAIARDHSARMAGEERLFHNDALFTRATHQRLGIKVFAENVSVARTVEEIHQDLLDSPRHHDNIDNPVLKLAGFAIVRGASGGLWATEDFGSARTGSKAAVVAGSTRRAPDARPGTGDLRPALRSGNGTSAISAGGPVDGSLARIVQKLPQTRPGIVGPAVGLPAVSDVPTSLAARSANPLGTSSTGAPAVAGIALLAAAGCLRLALRSTAFGAPGDVAGAR